MSGVPRRRAEPTGSTYGQAALRFGRDAMVRAQFLSSCTLCARFLSCAALCQPAPCSHPPPTSLGRALPTTASHSTAPLRFKLNGMHNAHRRCAHHLHAKRHHVFGTTRDGSTIDAFGPVGCACELPGGSRELACVRLPLHAAPDMCTRVHRRIGCCVESSADVSRREPCPCPCPYGLWPPRASAP